MSNSHRFETLEAGPGIFGTVLLHCLDLGFRRALFHLLNRGSRGFSLEGLGRPWLMGDLDGHRGSGGGFM